MTPPKECLEYREVQPAGRQHWIISMPWKTVREWRARAKREHGVATAERRTIEQAYPYQYASMQRRFCLMKTEDVLWLVSLPRYQKRLRQRKADSELRKEPPTYCQAPSIMARLEIEKVIDSEFDAYPEHQIHPDVRDCGRHVVIGRRNPNTYPPLNNVFSTMLSLQFHGKSRDMSKYIERDRSKDSKRGPYFSMSQHFRSLRHLKQKSGLDLDSYFEAVWKGHRVFLSYKRSDFYERDAHGRIGTDPVWARRLGEDLAQSGASCWWDRWQIPDIEEDAYDPGLLADILDDGIRQAVWFVGLITDNYLREPKKEGAVCWTLEEWRRAKEESRRGSRRQSLRRIAVFFQGRPVGSRRPPPPCEDGDRVIWAGESPEAATVARQILKSIGAA